jgi:hypothetical protein
MHPAPLQLGAVRVRGSVARGSLRRREASAEDHGGRGVAEGVQRGRHRQPLGVLGGGHAAAAD